jgi:hypothetical protein
VELFVTVIGLLEPSQLYAELILVNLSDVRAVVPETIPLFPFPLSSFAFPLKGHHPTKPDVGT